MEWHDAPVPCKKRTFLALHVPSLWMCHATPPLRMKWLASDNGHCLRNWFQSGLSGMGAASVSVMACPAHPCSC